MKVNNLKDRIDKVVYPVSIICLFCDFVGLILSILDYVTFNVYIYAGIVLIQFICVTILFLTNKKLKSDAYLFETFADGRISLFLAIKLILNLKGNVNNTKIEKVTLLIKITNVPMEVQNILDERYDCQFIWMLEGKNTTNKKLDKIFFRLAADNSVSLDSLNFSALQCENQEHRDCTSDIKYDCMSENCEKYIMRYNINDAIQKSNFYILPLEFKEALNQEDYFKIKATYTWPKCYNALVDYLIIDPYNPFRAVPSIFSNELEMQ